MIKQCRFLQLQLLKCSGAHKSSVCLLPVHEPGTGLAPHRSLCSPRQQHPVQVGCGVHEAFGPAAVSGWHVGQQGCRLLSMVRKVTSPARPQAKPGAAEWAVLRERNGTQHIPGSLGTPMQSAVYSSHINDLYLSSGVGRGGVGFPLCLLCTVISPDLQLSSIIRFR